MRKFPAAVCALAAFAIAQFVVGDKPPGERLGASLAPCSPADSCALKGALDPEKSETALAQPPVGASEPPAAVQAALEPTSAPSDVTGSIDPQAKIEGKPAEATAEPQPVPAELAALSPEPLVEPEPPPTVAAEPQPWVGRWRPITAAFAFANSHSVEPLAVTDVEPTRSPDAASDAWGDATVGAVAMPLDAEVEATRPSRLSLCSAIVSAARGNGLPISFFANLIWQESNFRLREISDAGALGVAQFVPETANEHGLINPFEPIHAIHTAGKLLRKLEDQYHNLGLVAAAYNAGPGRVNDWLTKRRTLPGETRAYVHIITGHRADQWSSAAFKHNPERVLMPAKAPCAEVGEEVAVQQKYVRIGRLMVDLANATKPPAPALPAAATPAMAANGVAAGAKIVAAKLPPKPEPNRPQAKQQPAKQAAPKERIEQASLLDRVLGRKPAPAKAAERKAAGVAIAEHKPAPAKASADLAPVRSASATAAPAKSAPVKTAAAKPAATPIAVARKDQGRAPAAQPSSYALR